MTLRALSLFPTAICLALATGFFYAYSCSVMLGLGALSDADFISAMQAINASVRNGLFAVSFFGSALLLSLATILHAPRVASRPAMLVLGAAVLYGLGTFTLTMVVTMPLNEWLALQGPPAFMSDARAIRTTFEERWVLFNDIRTLASLCALCLVLMAIWFTARDETRQEVRQKLRQESGPATGQEARHAFPGDSGGHGFDTTSTLAGVVPAPRH